jgi:hypothetical protein
VQFTHIIIVFTVLASTYHITLAWLAANFLGYNAMYECAIG